MIQKYFFKRRTFLPIISAVVVTIAAGSSIFFHLSTYQQKQPEKKQIAGIATQITQPPQKQIQPTVSAAAQQPAITLSPTIIITPTAKPTTIVQKINVNQNPPVTATSQQQSNNQPTATPTPSPIIIPSPTPTQTITTSVTLQINEPDGNTDSSVTLHNGANVCDVLTEAKNEGKIKSLTLDTSYMSSLNSAYVKEMNGYQNNWTFTVNGSSPQGCSLINPKNGDTIVWKFN